MEKKIVKKIIKLEHKEWEAMLKIRIKTFKSMELQIHEALKDYIDKNK
jgi:hypothetical protein